MQVAIDGGAGTGKSTVARAVAERLKLPYLNTGQLYRAVAYLAIIRVNGKNARLIEIARGIARGFDPVIEDGMVVYVGEWCLRGQLDTPPISHLASVVSADPAVREALLAYQRDFASRGAVLEGRDIGTVVLPDADCKIFLMVDPQEAAARTAAAGRSESLLEVERRNRRDSEREVAPLRPAEDADIIDTTGVPVGRIVKSICDRVAELRAV